MRPRRRRPSKRLPEASAPCLPPPAARNRPAPRARGGPSWRLREVQERRAHLLIVVPPGDVPRLPPIGLVGRRVVEVTLHIDLVPRIERDPVARQPVALGPAELPRRDLEQADPLSVLA